MVPEMSCYLCERMASFLAIDKIRKVCPLHKVSAPLYDSAIAVPAQN